MAKRKLFKVTSTARYEDMGSDGSWNPLVDFQKQQDAFASAYIDKVRISYILEGDTGNSTSQWGVLFAVSNRDSMSATDSSNTGYVLASGASRGGGGVVTLNVDRSIRDNDFDASSGQNALRLHARCTDIGTTTFAITVIIETWGRWHAVDQV